MFTVVVFGCDGEDCLVMVSSTGVASSSCCASATESSNLQFAAAAPCAQNYLASSLTSSFGRKSLTGWQHKADGLVTFDCSVFSEFIAVSLYNHFLIYCTNY